MIDTLIENYLFVCVAAVFGMVLLYMMFAFSDYIPHFLVAVYLTLPLFYKFTKIESLPLTTVFVIVFGPIILWQSRMMSITNYWPVAVYSLIVIVTSAINGVSMLDKISYFVPMLIALLCAMSLPARNIEKRMVSFMNLYFIWIALNAVFSILQLFGGHEYYLISAAEGYEINQIRRGYGLVGMATQIGLQFCLGLPLIASFYLGGKGKKTLWKLPLFILAVVGLILTFSRGAILGVAISMALLLLFHRKYKMFACYAVIGALIVISYLSLMQLLPEHYSHFFQGKDSSAASRLPYTLVSLRMFAEHPITGFGFGGFWEHCTRYGSSVHIEAHNTYAQVLVEYGIFGFILFTSIISMSLKGYWAYIRRGSSQILKMQSVGYLCGLFAILINATVHCFEWSLIFFLPIMFGFMMQYILNNEYRNALRTQRVNNCVSEEVFIPNVSQSNGLFP